MKKFLLLVVICILTTTILFSQTKDEPWALGLYGNLTTYQGDLGNHALDFGVSKLGFALTGNYYINPFFDLRARTSYSKLEVFDETGTYASGYGGYADAIGNNLGNWGFNGRMWTNTINLIFKFYNNKILSEDVKVKPYLNLGIGESRFKTVSTRDIKSTKNYHNRDLYWALGLRYEVDDKITIEIEGGEHYVKNDDLDGISVTTAPGWVNNAEKTVSGVGSQGPVGSVGSSNDDFYQFSFGLTYKLSKRKDSDSDGIFDKKDKCPGTPLGVEVDNEGCPLDKDKDGFADYIDKCPNIKGLIRGCPDRDKDKIADINDKCPNTKGDKRHKGCPDYDGDDVIDKEDNCPKVKGHKLNKGCPFPDTDKDGIIDRIDKCPNEKGSRANRGCPEVALPSIQPITIYFDVGKSYIKPKYYADIDNIIKVISQYDKVELLIEGHTDNTASKKYNLGLSKRRANAVKSYVINKGISASRIVAKFFGENNPVTDNRTTYGRLKNRRAFLRIIVK